MNRIFSIALIPSALFAFTACASAPTNSGLQNQAELRPPTQTEAERMMKQARETRAKKGCQEAAPAFRVIAGMGAGFEPAQHELAECLLTMTGASPTETALFRKEAMFWLERAAYAGNARAQRKLATLHGAPSGEFSDNAAALGWALVYGKNGQADLYGYKSLPATFAPGLEALLSQEDLASAHSFVENFEILRLGIYAPPPRRQHKEGESQRQRPDGRPGGKRPEHEH